MKFMARFMGGPVDGMMATLSTEKFVIGSIVAVRGFRYRIADGPAARFFEKSQSESEHLAVACVLDQESHSTEPIIEFKEPA